MRITIQDPVAEAATTAIEVVVELADGSRRWCYFVLPETLRVVGDWLPGTRVRVHYGARHMIVASELSEEIIRRTLAHLVESGLLASCTLPLES